MGKKVVDDVTLICFSRPSEVPEELVEEADQEVRPGTIPHGYEVWSKLNVVSESF